MVSKKIIRVYLINYEKVSILKGLIFDWTYIFFKKIYKIHAMLVTKKKKKKSILLKN